jgi:hypothetical protein
MRALYSIESELLRLKWQLAAMRFERAMRRHALALKAYNPEQPRNELGRWTDAGGAGRGLGGQQRSEESIQVAGSVIRVCLAGSSSRTTVGGVKTYSVTYNCAGGRSFTRHGFGHSFKGIVLDPLQ